MAEALAISPSYLNLIERNQRPLTVQLLLKLASVYKVDLDDLQGESAGSAGQLREVFADPLLVGEVPSPQELIEVADAAPNAASGVVKLYRAYREQAQRLSDLSDLLAREGHETALSSTRLPIDEVRHVFENRPAYVHSIDAAAEELHKQLSAGEDLAAGLRAWLQKTTVSWSELCPSMPCPICGGVMTAIPCGCFVRAPVAAGSAQGNGDGNLSSGASRGDWR